MTFIAGAVVKTELPEPTGANWTADEWMEQALAAADYYIKLQEQSPVVYFTLSFVFYW